MSFLGTYRKMDSSKASMAYSTWEVMKMIFTLGRKGLIFPASSIPVLPGISMSSRIRSKKKPSSVMS